jgi:hypothetical protein
MNFLRIFIYSFLLLIFCAPFANAQNYTIEVFAGNPIYGRPYFQSAIDRYNDYNDLNGKDAVKVRALNVGGKLGVQVSGTDGKWKVGFDYHWNNYKTNYTDIAKFGGETQLKFRYAYFGATVARRLFRIDLPNQESTLPFYYVMGLHFGTNSAAYRLKGSNEWQKQLPVGGVVYDRSGLILWDNGLQTEIPVYKFLYLYPKVGYQMNIAGEGGVAGLTSYLNQAVVDKNKMLNRAYLEILAVVRLNDLIK